MNFRNLTLLIVVLMAELSSAGLVRENYESVRASGMGNAFVSLADDSNAIWQNPAGLAYVKGAHFNLVDVTLGVDSLDTLTRIKNMVFHGDTTNFLRLDTQWQAANVKPVFITKYFGFSIYNQMFGFFDTSFVNILSVDVPNIDVYAFNDTAAIAAVGFPITRYFSFGGSARAILRSSIDANITAVDLISQLGLASVTDFEAAIYDNLKQLAGVGYGIGLNVGAMVKIPLGEKNAPQLSLASVVEDLGQTTFTAFSAGTPVPPPLRPNYIAGAAVTWPAGKHAKITFAGELRHMFEPIHFAKTAHLGLEYRHRYFALRTGYAEGYFTYGASFELLPHTRVHFASYAKELGTGFNERSQRWYTVQCVIGFLPY